MLRFILLFLLVFAGDPAFSCISMPVSPRPIPGFCRRGRGGGGFLAGLRPARKPKRLRRPGGAAAPTGEPAAHGGPRRPEGDDIVAQTLGSRRFLLNATDHHAQQMLRRDPQYYYKMLPYAEAMGQGRRFTGLFHGVRLEPCPWYEAAAGTPTTPAAFYDHFCETLAILNVSIRK